MSRKRQLVLIKLEDDEDRTSATVPLGSEADFREAVSGFNTAPDGGRASEDGSITLYGPGLVIEIVPAGGRVSQALVTCQSEDFAWPVLYRIC